jgi:site-specific recombinase XerD
MDANQTLENFYQMYESLIKEGQISPLTLVSYKSQLTKFYSRFSPQTLEDISNISRDDFRKFVFGMETKTDSKNAFLRVIRVYMNYLRGEKLITDENISDTKFGNKKTLKSQRENTPPLTEEELKKLLDVCKNVREKFMLEFLRYTGLRESSVANVRISDIDENGFFHVIAKGDKLVPVQIPTELLPLFNEYKNSRDTTKEYLFYPTRGRGAKNNKINPTSVYEMVKSLLDRTDISEERKAQITPHKFRHAFVTELYVTSPEAANQAVHHSSMSITKRYNDTPFAVGLDATKNMKVVL